MQMKVQVAIRKQKQINTDLLNLKNKKKDDDDGNDDN